LDVSDETAMAYLTWLQDSQLSKSPQRSHDDLIRFWNKFVASDGSGFKPLTRPGRSRQYSVSWSELPADLAKDAAMFKQASLTADPFSETQHRVVRPATAHQRDRMLRRLASAILKNDGSPEEIDSLANLVRPDPLKKGLRFFLDRAGGEPNQQVLDMTQLALAIAKHWAKLPEADILELERLAHRFDKPRRGLTEKNKERLRQFRTTARQDAFDLPLLSGRPSAARDSRSAMLMQTAVAIILLSVAPVRLGNLRSLDRAVHFRAAFSSQERDGPHVQGQ
jgi:hypothetical protein